MRLRIEVTLHDHFGTFGGHADTALLQLVEHEVFYAVST